LHVGGVFKRAEYFVVGDALKQALGCEHDCTGGGMVVVSAESWALISESFEAKNVGEHGNMHIQSQKKNASRSQTIIFRKQIE